MDDTRRMATDLATIKAILDTRGIKYEETPETRPTQRAEQLLREKERAKTAAERSRLHEEWYASREPTGRTDLEVPSEPKPRNDGYNGFFSVLKFSADGTLEQWSTWE